VKKTLALCCLAAGAAVISSGSVLADDNWMGAWTLNVEKSKFVPGPPPRSQTIKFEPADKGRVKLTADGVDGDGKAMHLEYTAPFDGTIIPWTGNPNADSASPRRIDANRYENIWRKGGKVVVAVSATVSSDGKTLTIIQRGKDAKGRVMDMLEVFERPAAAAGTDRP
jgi:hypothetical protein